MMINDSIQSYYDTNNYYTSTNSHININIISCFNTVSHQQQEVEGRRPAELSGESEQAILVLIPLI